MAERISDAEKLARIAKGLKCTPEQAKEVLAYDKRIRDRNEGDLEYDLPPDKRKIAHEYCRTGTRKAKPKPKKNPMVLNLPTKPKKQDTTKEGLISALAEFLPSLVDNVEIINKTRQIAFTMNGEKFELTLIRKQKQ